MAILLYLGPYFAMLVWVPNNVALLFGMWTIMGFAKAFIGTSVMHDSLHGSYSKNKKINSLIGISAWLLGVDSTVWKLQHNVLHHSYTNIDDADDDIAPRYVLRFSPNQPLRWFHKFQHVYALFFYFTSTLLWITLKDFVKASQYHKRGLRKKGSSLTLFLVSIFLKKASYLFLFLIVPIYVLPVSSGLVVLMFITMHLVASIMLSMIFQPAHVISTSEFYSADEEKINENWLVHQLRTTSNFGMNSRLLTWFSGGLNYQIEHHLFPHICHIHYRKISKIVQNLTVEYNLPYHSQKTLGKAVSNHFRMLKLLGRGAYID